MLATGKRKYDIFKLYYWHDAVLVGSHRLPQLAPSQSIPYNVISFNERSGVRCPEEHWLDFYIDDCMFECFWNQPQRYDPKLSRFAGIISPDYSMLPEMLPDQRAWNCTRNRVSAYYLQNKGYDVIPTASWCLEEDFSWCFDGLPEHSSIAISSNGCKSSPYGKRIFLEGIERLQQEKAPSHLIICGRPMEELNNYDNIVYYPSFSQRWKERDKYGK